MTTFVAVSGGVDSLLSLCLLKELGYRPAALHGFFLPPGEREMELRNELEHICSRRGVPFYCYDFSREFHARVIHPFLRDYAEGITPNPCAQCNRRVKFGLLLDTVRELGGDKLATGHYARVDNGAQLFAPALYRGADPAKEQSYFLSLVRPEQLRYALFPLGNWRKERTRQEIMRRVERVPAKRESQEVCFIPDNDYRRFLRENAPRLPQAGPIRDSSGRHLGRHRGLHNYTLGQRRGLGIPYFEPLYVLRKDLAENTLVVGTARELSSQGCRVKDMNLLLPWSHWPLEVLVQANYRQKPRRAQVEISGETAQVRFLHPAPPPAPGQVMAFYSEQGRVLAGGIISA